VHDILSSLLVWDVDETGCDYEFDESFCSSFNYNASVRVTAQQTLTRLVHAGAFEGGEGHCLQIMHPDLSTNPDELASLELLAEHNVVQCELYTPTHSLWQLTSFGLPFIRPTIRLQNPMPALMPRKGVDKNSMDLWELIMTLETNGWTHKMIELPTVVDASPKEQKKANRVALELVPPLTLIDSTTGTLEAASQVGPTTWWYKPGQTDISKNYLVSLLSAEKLLSDRVVSQIYHFRADVYYKALVEGRTPASICDAKKHIQVLDIGGELVPMDVEDGSLEPFPFLCILLDRPFGIL
jgi:hypothetical protein